MSRAMSSRPVILSFLVIALGLPASAAAQIDPGINYDPGSPAGKEYAIPLAEGRSEGAGTSDPRVGGNVAFGVGIEPPGGGSGGAGGAGTGGSEPGRQGEPGGAGVGGRIENEPGGASGSTSLAEAESQQGTAWQTLVMALAVLLPAALLAVVLAARRPSRTGRTA
jgi:hypothetical protein